MHGTGGDGADGTGVTAAPALSRRDSRRTISKELLAAQPKGQRRSLMGSSRRGSRKSLVSAEDGTAATPSSARPSARSAGGASARSGGGASARSSGGASARTDSARDGAATTQDGPSAADDDGEGASSGSGDSSDDGGSSDDEDDEDAICGGETRRAVIEREGGVRQLIAMLNGSNLPSFDSKAVAASGWAKARIGVAGTIEIQPIFPGSQVDFGVRIGMQEQGAATLSDLASCDEAMQNAIIDCGGVKPLLDLIRLGSSVAQEHAARTIVGLCEQARHLLASPRIAPHRPASPRISPHLTASHRISPHLTASRCISSHLLAYRRIAPHRAESPRISRLP